MYSRNKEQQLIHECYKQVIKEEYTYFLDKSIDKIINTYNDDIKRSKQNINYKIKELKDGGWFDGDYAFSENQTKKVIQCLKIFHEAEYKFSFLKQHNIQCKECINIIDKTFNYIKTKFYFTAQYWLLAHNCVNDFFNFKTLNIQDWDDIENWGPGDEEQKKYKTPSDWPGNDPENFDVYVDQIRPITQRLETARTIEEKIVAITIALNSIHTNGQMLEYGGFDPDDLTLLSNLDARVWKKEINKEFGIRF